LKKQKAARKGHKPAKKRRREPRRRVPEEAPAGGYVALGLKEASPLAGPGASPLDGSGGALPPGGEEELCRRFGFAHAEATEGRRVS